MISVKALCFRVSLDSTYLSIHLFIYRFFWTDIVTTISHEHLEQSRWKLQGVFTSPYWWSDYILEVKVKVTSGHRGVKDIHVEAGESKVHLVFMFNTFTVPIAVSVACCQLFNMLLRCVLRRSRVPSRKRRLSFALRHCWRSADIRITSADFLSALR